MYLLIVFFLIPLTIFGLSLIRPLWVMGGILIVVGILAISIVIIKILQNKAPQVLPVILRDWKFLPLGFRSLEPYDRIVMKFCGCCKCCDKSNYDEGPETLEIYKEAEVNGSNGKAKEQNGEPNGKVNYGYEKENDIYEKDVSEATV